jgi:DNA-directed RNA polymerase subunit RPC12/RpoP
MADIATLHCFNCGEKLTTVREGDERHLQAKKDGLPCPKCGKVCPIQTSVQRSR